MHTETTTLQGGPNDGTADTPSKQNKKGEAAGAAPPMNVNLAGEHELTAHEENNSSSAAVDPGGSSSATLRNEPVTNSSAAGDTTAAIEAARTKAMAAVAAAPVEPDDDELGSAILRARKSQHDVAALVTARKHHVSMPIAKPASTGKYLRAREGEEWSYVTNAFRMFEPKRTGEREYLMVHPDLEEFVRSRKQLAAATRTFGLAFLVDASGSPSYWPLNLQDTGDWGTSARLAVEVMKANWGMVVNNGDNWAVEHPEEDLGDPTWPPGSADEWLLKAFRERIVDTEDHPLIKKLLGRK